MRHSNINSILAEKKEGVNKNIPGGRADVLDLLILVGKDRASETMMQEFVQSIKLLCENRQLKVLIIGDGKSPINLNELKKLKHANNLLVYGHGSINKSDNCHTIDLFENHSNITLDIIEQVQDLSNARNIILCSCFGFKIEDDIRSRSYPALQQETSLFVPSAKDEISFSDKNSKIMHNYVNITNPLQIPSMLAFVAETIKTIPENMGYICQPRYQAYDYQPIFSHMIRRPDRLIYHDVEKYCEYLINEFNAFINQTIVEKNGLSLRSELEKVFPDLKNNLQDLAGLSLFSAKMSSEQIKSFQELSLETYVQHKDLKIIDALLEKNQFNPDLLAIAILFHGIQYDKRDMTSMVDILLVHSRNCYLEQNANHFASNMAFNDYYDLFRKYGLKGLILTLYTPLTLALAQENISLGPFSVFNVKPINHNVVRTLIAHGADIYLSDSLGRVPVDFLRQSEYENLFKNNINKMIKINDLIMYAKIILNGLNEDEKTIFKDSCEKINNLLLKQEEWKNACEVDNDMDHFNLKVYPPKTKAIYQAYDKVLIAANKINLQDLFIIALKSQNCSQILNNAFQAKPLYQLLKEGNVEKIDLLIEHAVDLNLCDPETLESPLMIAVKNGYADIAKNILEKIKLSDEDRNTVIFQAIIKIPSFVKKLVENGANITNLNLNEFDQTPFQVAIAYKRFSLMPLLLTDKEAINNRDPETDEYPIYKIILSEEIKCLDYVLKAGAKLDIKWQNTTPLAYAIIKEKFESIKLILKHNPNSLFDTANDKSLLYVAANSGSIKIFNFLINKGLSWKDQEELQSLFLYCNRQNICEILIKHEIDLTFVDKGGNNLLHSLMIQKFSYSDQFKAKLILDQDKNPIDINASNKDGNTALHLAALCGKMEIAQLLLERGADIFAKNYDGKTAKELVEDNYAKPRRDNDSDNYIDDKQIDILQLLTNAESMPLLKTYIFNPLITYIKQLLNDLLVETPNDKSAAISQNTKISEKLHEILSNINQEISLFSPFNNKKFETWLNEVKTLKLYLPELSGYESIKMEIRKRAEHVSDYITPKNIDAVNADAVTADSMNAWSTSAASTNSKNILAEKIPVQQFLAGELENHRLMLIKNLQDQVRLNTNFLGVTINPGRNEILKNLLQMLFYKKIDNEIIDKIDFLNSKEKTSPSELIYLHNAVVDHLQETKKILEAEQISREPRLKI